MNEQSTITVHGPVTDHSDKMDALISALNLVQKAMGYASKDTENPHFKSTFASLKSAWEAAKDPLLANGFALTQQTVTKDGKVSVRTILWHTSGQWISAELPLINPKGDMQGMGSAITYARRQSFMSLIGLCPVDDDGNDAQDQADQKPRSSAVRHGANASPARQTDPTEPKKKPVSGMPATAQQVKLFWVLWKKTGRTEEHWRQELLGRGLESTNQVNGKDMSTIISSLKKEVGE